MTQWYLEKIEKEACWVLNDAISFGFLFVLHICHVGVLIRKPSIGTSLKETYKGI